MATIALSDGCMQAWRPLWEPCQQKGSFNVTIGIDLGASEPLPVGSEYIRPSASIEALTHDDICKMSGDFGKCGRSVIAVMGPLLFCKLVLSAFLTPAIVLWYTHLRTQGDGSRSGGRSSLVHARRARALKLLAMFGEIELGDKLEVNGMWADQLEYLELTIIFSALIPILLPLVIVIVWTNFISVAHLLRHFDIEVRLMPNLAQFVPTSPSFLLSCPQTCPHAFPRPHIRCRWRLRLSRGCFGAPWCCSRPISAAHCTLGPSPPSPLQQHHLPYQLTLPTNRLILLRHTMSHHPALPRYL